MNLTNNIPETMIPGSYSEFNYYAGPNGLPANIQKVLLVGDIADGGSLAVAKPTAVYNESEVLALAGAGSVLHQMYKAAKNAWKYAQISLLRHTAVAGSAAVWTITLSGTATKSGLVRVIWNSKKVAVGVSVGNTADYVADSLAVALNAETDAPFTAVAENGVVTLTAKNKGAYICAEKGGVNISVETESTDLTATGVVLTAGSGDVDVEDALAGAFPERYHLIALSVSDATNIGYLKTHLEKAAEPLEQRGQRGIVSAIVSGVSNAISLAKSFNYERLHIAAVKNSIPATTWEIAAGLAAIFASNSQPNKPMNGLPVPGIGLPDIADKWNGEEQDALLYGGVIPLVETDSELCIVRAVTTRSTKDGVRFTKLIDTGVIASLDYFRDSILAMHKVKYKNKVIHELLPDALNEDNIAVAKSLEGVQILRFIDQYADQFITEESKDEPGRMLCQIPAPVVPGLNQIYSTIDLYIN